MAWVRLADDFADHPKIVAAGPLAGWLWLCGIAYCNRYLTDGFVPAAQVKRLADVDDPASLAVRLLDVGLWERAPGGYRVHDYAGYQPSAEAVKAERERNAKRAATFRERHAGSNAGSNGVSPDAPYPVPVPVNNPVPAATTTPQPPPPAEGAVAPPTAKDRELWHEALRGMSPGLLPANAAKLAALELLGRAPDGGLRLRAPPGTVGGRQWRRGISWALREAGDQAAEHVAIVEG